MASRSGQKIRLVKCPKCLKILQEDEDVPVYQCGGCSAILRAKKRNIAPNSAGETEGAQANEQRNESETNNVSSSSGQDTVLPSSPGRSSDKTKNASVECMEKELGAIVLSNRDEAQQQECSLGDSEKNERAEDNSRLKSNVLNNVTEAAGSEASFESLSVDHGVAARESNSSVSAEISPRASPVEEKQSQIDYTVNKTCSAYDGTESSSSDEREDNNLLVENEEWTALQKIRSGKFEMPRWNYKEQGASSSSTYSEKRHQNRALQLEGRGGRLDRQERRHATQQLRSEMPLYPRESYTRVSPSYLSHDEFDRYSRAHSLQIPPYVGHMNHECIDYMFHNNTRGRGRVQGSRNRAGWYPSQLHDSYSSYSVSPQRLIEQPEYYPRWSHEIVSDVEDLHRNRHGGHNHYHHRRLKERQHVAKRHVRPTAGGAPFVNCYSCSQNLELPVDFLIFKKKHHLIRCGTCSTVLRFSLQSKTHLVPAVSSNSKSESPSSSSVQNNELPVSRGSPLHRLMGYSTVSQVFKASQRPPSV